MLLHEDKLLTIEAMNRLAGFVWPEDMKYACMFKDKEHVYFFQVEPTVQNEIFDVSSGWVETKRVGVKHPNWRKSLVTREEFEAIDGWVRSVSYKEDDGTFVEKALGVNGVKWRYHKLPVPVTTSTEEEPTETNIGDLYKKYSDLGKVISDLRDQIQNSVSEQNLIFDQIEVYNLAHGIVVTGVNVND